MAEADRLIQGYATALFAVAEAEGNLEVVESELFQFSRIVQREGKLRDALTDPQLPAERKMALIHELLGSRASRPTVGLLGFLVEQGRAKDLPRIIEGLTEVAAERRRKAVAEVRTAVPLDEQRRARLVQALARASGKDIELRALVDEDVIGGVMARVGDQVFDGTIKRKLELAREQLGRAG